MASSSSTGTTTLTSGSATIGQGYRWPTTPALTDNPAPMFTRVQVRALAAERWPALLGGAAVVGYAILVVGFGLDFRPLHHDEVVTLHVAGQPSAGDVLHVAIWDRHGPPLHYLIVHASLDWRHDILGLRLPSALFGILAVGLAYGCGRELMGRAGGATMAVVTAVTPITIHLAQFARGYTAMIACAYGSLWLMLVLLRTGRLRWAVPYALARAAPRGVAPVRPLRARLRARAAGRARRVRPARRGGASDRRAIAALAAGLVLGAAAFLWLRHLYSPLQSKYGVGSGGAVVDLTSRSFWSDLASHVTGSSVPAFWFLVGCGRRARDRLARVPRPPGGDRRRGVAASCRLLLLQILTASSRTSRPSATCRSCCPGTRSRSPGSRSSSAACPGGAGSSRSSSSPRCSRRSSCRAGTTSRTSTPISATRASASRPSSARTTSS